MTRPLVYWNKSIATGYIQIWDGFSYQKLMILKCGNKILPFNKLGVDPISGASEAILTCVCVCSSDGATRRMSPTSSPRSVSNENRFQFFFFFFFFF